MGPSLLPHRALAALAIKGTLPILSAPEPTTISAFPAFIAWYPRRIAVIEAQQALSIVREIESSGNPARRVI